MPAPPLEGRQGLTRSRSTPPARRDLGRELRRLRAEELELTQLRMAEWLGVATTDDRGRPTSTGKSLVSRFESGARRPDAAVLDQYAKVPGVDAARLRALWADAADAADATDGPGPDEPSPTVRGPRLRRVLVPLAAVVVLGVAASLWWGLRGSGRSTDADDLLVTPLPGVSLVFDALGEQSDQTIRIYHGPGDSSSDRDIDGSYEDGQSAAIVCLTRGRTVTSNPAAHEEFKTSDEWARIVASDGRLSYATMTYARISPTTAKVPTCEAQPSG